MTSSGQPFVTVRSVGGLIPPGVLERIGGGDQTLGGLTPEAYHLAEGERLNEAITRSWTRLLPAWSAFRRATQEFSGEEAGTATTREKWLLILFQELGFGRLQSSKSIVFEGKSYPISHVWQRIPIHLVGLNVSLDRRTAGIAGAARSTPHGVLQELLNRSPEMTWGLVSNGRLLRILRDNQSLTRQAYLEFDMEAMMEGEAYSDFVLLWLVCHQSRFEGSEPGDYWIEKWRRQAIEQGTRALESLRDSVENAIRCLGSGFLSHRENMGLRESLRTGKLTSQDYYHQLLRLIYRFIFLLVAEERDLLLLPTSEPRAREVYRHYYSFARLRFLAEQRRGTQHSDAWAGLQVTMKALGADTGCSQLALPALGGFLWEEKSLPDVLGCLITNESLLNAIRSMTFTQRDKVTSKVDFKNLGPEELGGIYEALLELKAEVNIDTAEFSLLTLPGHERHLTGSYYTTSSVVETMLDTSLEPLLGEAVKRAHPDSAILGLKICDPACGSGHFLIAAAHRIAGRLATIRSEGSEPSPSTLRSSLREVVSHCIYGVDVNPMAVELCKVNLWLEAMEPGLPLTFLDHRIQLGNSLLGTFRQDLAGGLPDTAFERKDGDDPKVVVALRKQNVREREGQTTLGEFDSAEARATVGWISGTSDDDITKVHEKERNWNAYVHSTYFLHSKFVFDAWSVAFTIPHVSEVEPITSRTLKAALADESSLSSSLREVITVRARELRLFHWELAFPDVFSGSSESGFDLLIGNPPWVRQELFRPWKPLLCRLVAYTSTADLSVSFVEVGLRLCRNGGFLSFLTPNKWFRAAYGRPLRALVSSGSTVKLLVDFGHTRTLFPGEDTFPAIIVTQRGKPRSGDTFSSLRFSDFDQTRPDIRNALIGQVSKLSLDILSKDEWLIEGETVLGIIDRIKANSIPLEMYLGSTPLSGIKTGFDRAFYIDEKFAHELLEQEAYREVIRPLIRGRDLKAWRPKRSHHWMIFIVSSENRKWPWSGKAIDEAEQSLAETYPRIYAHLKAFEEALKKREDQGAYWWELRSCSYYGAFLEPKTLIPVISYHPAVCIDDSGAVANNKTMMLMSTDPLVIASLNSRVGWWFMTMVFPHMKDEALAMQADFLSKFPIPKGSQSLGRIRELVDLCIQSDTPLGGSLSALREISLLVSSGYALTNEQIDYIDAHPAARDPLTSAGRGNGQSSS